MDALCLVIINGISLALLFSLLALWKPLRRQFPEPVLFDLVAYFAAAKLLMVLFVPALLRISSDWRYDRSIGAAPTEIVAVYAIELVSYLAWLSSLFVIARMRWFRILKAGAGTMPARGPRRTVPLFFLALGILYLVFVASIARGAAASENYATIFFRPAALLAGPVLGLYCVSLRRRQMGNLLFGFGLLVSVVAVLHGLASGSRGQLAWMGLWLFFLYFFVSRKRVILYGALASFAIVALFHAVLVEVRQGRDFGAMSAPARIAAFYRVQGGTHAAEDLLSSVEQRFGEASRLSVAFFRLYNSGQAAGWRPVASALYAPIPRKFFPDKPEPGSTDGTKQSMGMYLIQDVMKGTPWNMSDFFTGAHSYWELGIIGVFLFSFGSALFISFCANYFARFGRAGLPLMMIMLFPPWNDPKLWMSQIILNLFHILVPLLFLWQVARFCARWRLRRGIGHMADPGSGLVAAR